jgi:hypothetical protein
VQKEYISDEMRERRGRKKDKETWATPFAPDGNHPPQECGVLGLRDPRRPAEHPPSHPDLHQRSECRIRNNNQTIPGERILLMGRGFKGRFVSQAWRSPKRLGIFNIQELTFTPNICVGKS